MGDDGGTGGSVSVDDIEDTRGKADFGGDFGERDGGHGGELGGLDDDGVAGGEGGGDLPGEHQQGEVPGDDLADDADGGLVAEAGVFAGEAGVGDVAEELGPAGVVVEVAGDEGDIDVAGLADGLAVVDGFEDGELAGVLLYLAGEGVKVTGALVAGECLPAGEGGAGGFDGRVDDGGVGVGDGGDEVAGGGVRCGEGLALRGGPLAVDEVAEGAFVLVEPAGDLGGVFGGGTVFHAFELFHDAGCHCVASF